jgi:hypothetical protein
MINEIDKICPEEGLPTQQSQDMNQIPQAQQVDSIE